MIDIGRAEELRLQGWTLEAIGDEFGVSRQRIRQILGGSIAGPSNCLHCGAPIEQKPNGQPRKYCNDQCRKNAWEAKQTPPPCPECGGPRNRKAALCRECRIKVWQSGSAQTIQRMWNAGEPMAVIARELDVTVNYLGVYMHRLRGYGFDLPYRRKVHINGSPAFPDLGYDERPRKVVPLSELGPRERAARKANKPKERARRQLHRAIERGELTRPDTCERCKATARIEAHHQDYSKPLEVEWLCFDCHRSHHVAERRAA